MQNNDKDTCNQTGLVNSNYMIPSGGVAGHLLPFAADIEILFAYTQPTIIHRYEGSAELKATMHRYIQSDEAADSDNEALSCKPPEEV